MRNILSFEEFLNESYLNEDSLWFAFKPKAGSTKVETSLGKAEIWREDTLTGSPGISSSGKSLGVKATWIMVKDPKADKETRYVAVRILNGPRKDSTLFCAETFIRDEFTTSKNVNWYSTTPGSYKFKNVSIDAEPIPADLKSIHDELIGKI